MLGFVDGFNPKSLRYFQMIKHLKAAQATPAESRANPAFCCHSLDRSTDA
jgi:hypothetical protein